ncbi:hypothetical protein GCM10023116_07440 [Kistimonas scapharcae]|uniref:Uncharacterized protein n=1 Tax=Kistimonas scapharcae TaxID=1036133 RepID=A0ABP8UZE0_9GAMM
MSEGIILRREAATAFSTRQVKLVRTADGYDLLPFGDPLTFSEMAAIRSSRTVSPAFPDSNEISLANVGISVLLKIQVCDNEYLVLVEQDRGDAGRVLKLVSGYVETAELDNPFDTVLREISEEVLFKQGAGYFPFYFDTQPVGNPYELPQQSGVMELHPSGWLAGQQGETVSINGQSVTLPVHLYVHCPTNSVQLVYSLTVALEAWPEQGFYVEDEKEDGFLVSRLRPERRFILVQCQGERLQGYFQLIDGKLTRFDGSGYRFSEFFAPRKNRLFVTHQYGGKLNLTAER